MTAAWTADELRAIGNAELAELATVRGDGSPRRPVTVWVVRHRDELFVRSWRGRHGAWFRALRSRPEGHLRAGGVAKDVAFLAAAPEIDDAVDEAYRTKYRHYGDSYLEPMIAPQARATTLRVEPR